MSSASAGGLSFSRSKFAAALRGSSMPVAAVAAAAGVSMSTVRRWASCRAEPRASALARTAQAIGADLAEFAAKERDRTSHPGPDGCHASGPGRW